MEEAFAFVKSLFFNAYDCGCAAMKIAAHRINPAVLMARMRLNFYANYFQYALQIIIAEILYYYFSVFGSVLKLNPGV